MFLLYTLIYTAALVFLFPVEYLKRPKEIRERWLNEKLGGCPAGGDSGVRVAIHAVSVGEAIAAATFVKALKGKYPNIRPTVFTITDTGQKVAKEKLSGIAEIAYLPFDIPVYINKCIKNLRPDVFIVMETELWPNLFRALNSSGIPVIVMNGRLSEKSFSGYLKIRFFMRKVLSHVRHFYMQNEEYAERIIKLGVEKERVTSIGNFKFDISPPSNKPSWADALGSPVIVAGSTHEGEEEIILSAFLKLRESWADLTLILAPRHPERFGEVEKMLIEKNVGYKRRSGLDKGIKFSVILLDSVGELFSVYGVADIAIMGGSFIKHGGQNPLEPACWGKPVVCGPYMENFPFMKEFYGSGAAVEADKSGLYDVLYRLLSSPEDMRKIGGRADELLQKNRGAVEEAIKAMGQYIS